MTTQTRIHHMDSLARAHALSVHHYFGDDSLALERRDVFGRSWQMVAHVGQLAEPGDHVVEEVAGTPVLVLRGRDGVLRAFPNVCRHRAGPLALCSGKGMHTVRCKYHGWLYNQEGRLIGAPGDAGREGLPHGRHPLPALRIREWQGLVFVALNDDAPAFDEVSAASSIAFGPSTSIRCALRVATCSTWRASGRSTSTTSSRGITC
jgi:choline monooxygenase